LGCPIGFAPIPPESQSGMQTKYNKDTRKDYAKVTILLSASHISGRQAGIEPATA